MFTTRYPGMPLHDQLAIIVPDKVPYGRPSRALERRCMGGARLELQVGVQHACHGCEGKSCTHPCPRREYDGTAAVHLQYWHDPRNADTWTVCLPFPAQVFRDEFEPFLLAEIKKQLEPKLKVRGVSRSTPPRWGSIRFRPLTCTYDAPPCWPARRVDGLKYV